MLKKQKNGKQLKYWGIGILCLAFLVGVYLFPLESALAERQTLYWGSKGSEVNLLQNRLKQWGYYSGSVDGNYGGDTAQAVRNFQRKNGLTPDGIVGASTWAALGYSTSSKAKSNPVVPVSSKGVSQADSVELLARAITGEARGEPYLGQVAVAAVILNRVEDPRFPKSIAGVIYQPGAFTAVNDGQINLEPTAVSRKAARDALNGWDPTYGAVYYYNPKKTTNAWIWTRAKILNIGEHVFAH